MNAETVFSGTPVSCLSVKMWHISEDRLDF
jgi:hypothetical protein